MPRLAAATALLLLSTACHGGAPSGPAPASEVAATRQELLRQMESSAAAWNRGDLAGHVALYTDSAQMMFKAGPRGGRETIRTMLERAFWKDGKPYQQLAFSELVVTPLGRDHAMLTGRFALSGGDKPAADGRYTLIWQRTTAGWRIIHDHSS